MARASNPKTDLSNRCHTTYLLNNPLLKDSKMSQNYYVYTHSTATHGIFYVGKGSEKRIKNPHRKENPRHTNIVNKYGKENIIIKTMLCHLEQHALNLEVRMIAALRSSGVDLVNCSNGGDGAKGFSISEETKAKISTTSKGRRMSDENKEKVRARMMGNKYTAGKKLSPEIRSKMSDAQKNRVNSEYRCTKQVNSMKGNTLRLGTKVSDETRAKMSASHKGNLYSLGRKHPEEAKAKMRESHKNRPPISDETRAKLSAAKKGVTRTEEQKQKMSIAQQKRRAKKTVEISA